MDKKETTKIIAVLMAAYPNFLNNKTRQDIEMTINVWNSMLEDYSYKEISLAIKMCISQNGDFAPSIGKVIKYIDMINSKDKNEMTEVEAWGLVRKAISNSGYNSEREFNKLPRAIQKAIGNAEVLKNWSQETIDGIEKVIGSNFMRSYRASCDRQREYKALPTEVKNLLDSKGGIKEIGTI